MIFCNPQLSIFWNDKSKLKFKGYHVTPYLNSILKSGKILPTVKTGKSTLGENTRMKTLRGCLISFYDDLELAMNGCYSLALYALLFKKLITKEQLLDLIKDEWYELYESDLFWDPDNYYHSSPEDAYPLKEMLNVCSKGYDASDIGLIFGELGTYLGFQNPHILTNEWVDDLPDSVEGILKSIGIFEVSFEKKYIIDPSAYYGSAPSLFLKDEYVASKGNFGIDFGIPFPLLCDGDFAEQVDYDSSKAAQFIAEHCHNPMIRLETEAYTPDDIEELVEYNPVEILQYGPMLVVNKKLAFMSGVNLDLTDLALWNPSEMEWRIAAYNGIPVNKSNLVTLAGDIQTAIGGFKLKYKG